LIEVEYTYVYTKDGEKRNGNLMYTIRPIQEAINYDLEKQFKRNAMELKKAEIVNTIMPSHSLVFPTVL